MAKKPVNNPKLYWKYVREYGIKLSMKNGVSEIQANFPETQPVGYALAMTPDGLATLKRIPNLTQHGIKIVELQSAGIQTEPDEEAYMMSILPLAEKELDSAIASYQRAAETSKAATSRLHAVHEDMKAAAERLRKTLAA